MFLSLKVYQLRNVLFLQVLKISESGQMRLHCRRSSPSPDDDLLEEEEDLEEDLEEPPGDFGARVKRRMAVVKGNLA